MSIERITGLLFSGYSVMIGGAGLALWLASEAASMLTHTLAQVSHLLG